VNFFIWAPVLAGLGTLKEVKTEWNIYDVMDAHEALDIKNEIEEKYMNDKGLEK